MIRVYEIHCERIKPTNMFTNYEKVKRHFEKYARWEYPIIWEADDENKIITIAIGDVPSIRLIHILKANKIRARKCDIDYLNQFNY